ncbi:MAG: GNAT family N-acetyltransferase, partial [Pseudomonadota bacterium]
HVGGRDDSVRDFSAGLMLQAHCIRWAIAHRFEEFDFTIGNEPYKHSLGGVDRHIVSRELVTRTGANVGGTLDPTCQDAVRQLIQRYVAKGYRDRARVAATQALETWPALSLDDEIKSLASD